MSTIVDGIQALHCRREFRQGLLAGYVDLCKVFDSVNWDALWRILDLCGVPPKLINLVSELYSGTENAVRCGDTISDLFLVVTGVRQVCVLAPTLYRFPGSKLRSRLSITDLMLLSCLYPFAVRMLRSQRDSHTLAVIFTSLLAVSQRSIDVWIGPVESSIHCILGCGAVSTNAGRKKVRVFKSLVLPVLLYGCETWTLNWYLRQRLTASAPGLFGESLAIAGQTFCPNERLLKDT